MLGALIGLTINASQELTVTEVRNIHNVQWKVPEGCQLEGIQLSLSDGRTAVVLECYIGVDIRTGEKIGGIVDRRFYNQLMQ